ncbi:thioredoxin-related transmembrane protein 2 [Eucalyptus grandis]|uniref:thioredoxin-related transmembrane protein 2 n=1 Tax=Eucalyptus grandis TaxID=71139 RepID=UPI00192EBB1E|nr:thioredoxin-related transmembrane protein 2 [Eucalyptus grandis]XP_039166187.1 thioredoxin-related transmembrane protein 2 [Eucalyptus grandis]XP_039166188.1 thioredoxin-related transmembrane protein 2 [Eucalyptus grandis]
MEWLSAAASEPYYLFHLLAFFSYLPIRCSAALVLSPAAAHLLLRREIQAVLAFLALAAVKLVREETWEAFIADSLFFSKVFLIVVTLVIDYQLALWYILIFLVIYTLTQQPVSQFLGAASKLTPLQLETVLNDGSTSRFWLVEFRSSSSTSCIRASRCFAELSITYSNKNLSFAIVDLGLFPIVAEKFGISLGNMAQLPTYILFENATEIARFPDIDLGVKISYPPITKGLLSRHFELDRLLLEYVNGK